MSVYAAINYLSEQLGRASAFRSAVEWSTRAKHITVGQITSIASNATNTGRIRRHPSCSCSYHFFSLCQLTTLTIHNSLCRSLPAQDLPLPQIFPSIASLPASGLTPRTSRPDRFFWASPFYVCFSFFIILFCLVPCGRLSWLLVSFWAHVNIVHCIVSYRIVQCVWTNCSLFLCGSGGLPCFFVLQHLLYTHWLATCPSIDSPRLIDDGKIKLIQIKFFSHSVHACPPDLCISIQWFTVNISYLV